MIHIQLLSTLAHLMLVTYLQYLVIKYHLKIERGDSNLRRRLCEENMDEWETAVAYLWT